MRNVAEPVVRGCGVRVKGGLYLEAELGPDGIPPQQYLVCPPEPINPVELGVTPIGVQIVDFGGVSHVLDWVGRGRKSRIGPLCPYCRSKAKGLNGDGGSLLSGPDAGALGIADTAIRHGHVQDDISLSSLRDEEGATLSQDVSGGSVVEGDTVEGASSPSTGGRDAETYREPLGDPVNRRRVSHGDGERGSEVNLPTPDLSHPVDGDTPFAVDQTGKVGPLGRGKFGEVVASGVDRSSHEGSILPNQCTCKYVYEGGYPNVADYLAELRNHGASRRISKSADFSRLTPESRLLLIHARAVIKNAAELWQALGGVSTWVCPVHGPGGCSEGGQTCHALYREVVEGGRDNWEHTDSRAVIREVGDTTYHANSTPEGFTPEWGTGIFARLPITRIAAIRDDASGAHDEAAAAARESSIPVAIEDQ